MNQLEIRFNDAPVTVDRLSEDTFCVHLPDGDLRLQFKPDNEGADHWMNLETNQESELTRQLGERIGPLIQPR